MEEKKNAVTGLLDGRGSIELVQHTGDELLIVNTARIAHNRQTQELTESDLGVLRGLLTNRHTSPLEHVIFTFLVKAPIFVARQWMRHRTWSYSELSRRYTRDDIEFYVPAQFTGLEVSGIPSILRQKYESIYAQELATYETLIAAGVRREQARAVLPVGMYTRFYATVDLNNLIKFLILREDSHAQYEIRVYADAIKTLVRPYIPHIAEYLNWN